MLAPVVHFGFVPMVTRQLYCSFPSISLFAYIYIIYIRPSSARHHGHAALLSPQTTLYFIHSYTSNFLYIYNTFFILSLPPRPSLSVLFFGTYLLLTVSLYRSFLFFSFVIVGRLCNTHSRYFFLLCLFEDEMERKEIKKYIFSLEKENMSERIQRRLMGLPRVYIHETTPCEAPASSSTFPACVCVLSPSTRLFSVVSRMIFSHYGSTIIRPAPPSSRAIRFDEVRVSPSFVLHLNYTGLVFFSITNTLPFIFCFFPPFSSSCCFRYFPFLFPHLFYFLLFSDIGKRKNVHRVKEKNRERRRGRCDFVT